MEKPVLFRGIDVGHDEVVDFHHADITDDEAVELAQALKQNPNLKRVILYGNEIGNKGAVALAELMVEKKDTLEGMWLYTNKIGEVGALAIADAMKGNTQLVQLLLFDNSFGEQGLDVLEKSILSTGSRNLTQVSGVSYNTEMRCMINKKNVVERSEQLGQYRLDPPIIWLEILECLPAIRNNEVHPVTQEIEDFLAFVDTLPSVELTSELRFADLHKVERETGFTPLDNPRTWQNFGQVIATLGANGQRIGAAELLSDGKASPFLKRAIMYGKALPLFTKANWQGASAGELKAVLNVLPKDFKDKIPNQHALMASVDQRQNKTIKVGGR